MACAREAAAKLLSTPQSPNVYLDFFWSAAADATRGQKLALLKAMGEIKPARQWTEPDKRRREMRKHFTFALIDFTPEDRCFLCGGEWRHRHHILNVQHGGGNSRRNIIPLCRTCHTQVHGRSI